MVDLSLCRLGRAFEAGRQGAAQISARWAAPARAVCVGETLRAQGTVPSRITRDGAVLGDGCFSGRPSKTPPAVCRAAFRDQNLFAMQRP
jgi:hypothetical protein